MSDRRAAPILGLARRTGRVLWWAILSFSADEGPQRAGHIAFAALLALFPFLIFLTALAGFLGQSQAAREFVAFALGMMPREAATAIRPAVDEVLARQRGDLLTLGLGGALWAASSGIEALRLALNQAYRVPRPRPFWQRRLQGIGIVIIAAAAVLVATLAVVVGPWLWTPMAARLGISAPPRWLWDTGRYTVAGGGLFITIVIFYRWLPNRRHRLREVVPGAVVATLAWLVLASAASLYFSLAESYTVTYGSLGGIVVALMFFYSSAAVFVFGAEINAVLAGKRPDAEP